MTDMTSKQIHEVIDRALKTVAARFDKGYKESPPARGSELAEEPRTYHSR